MYEKFTDRARKAMQLANQDARSYGLTEVFPGNILRGLHSAGTGTGLEMLKNIDVNIDTVLSYLASVYVGVQDPVGDHKLPLSFHSKKVLELAVKEAEKLGHNYVGTEHLVMGLFLDYGFICAALVKQGATIEKMHTALAHLIGATSLSTSPPSESAPSEVKPTHVDKWTEIIVVPSSQSLPENNKDDALEAVLSDVKEKLKLAASLVPLHYTGKDDSLIRITQEITEYARCIRDMMVMIVEAHHREKVAAEAQETKKTV